MLQHYRDLTLKFIVHLQLLDFQYVYRSTKPGITLLHQAASVLRVLA